MKSSSRNTSGIRPNSPKRPVWLVAIAILLAGAVLGYLFRGSSSQTASAGSLSGNQQAGSTSSNIIVQPLLDRLKDNPNDPELLANIGNQYYDNHDYGKAVEYAPPASQFPLRGRDESNSFDDGHIYDEPQYTASQFGCPPPQRSSDANQQPEDSAKQESPQGAASGSQRVIILCLSSFADRYDIGCSSMPMARPIIARATLDFLDQDSHRIFPPVADLARCRRGLSST